MLKIDIRHGKTPLHWAVFGGGAARLRVKAPGGNKEPFQKVIEVLKARCAKE